MTSEDRDYTAWLCLRDPEAISLCADPADCRVPRAATKYVGFDLRGRTWWTPSLCRYKHRSDKLQDTPPARVRGPRSAIVNTGGQKQTQLPQRIGGHSTAQRQSPVARTRFRNVLADLPLPLVPPEDEEPADRCRLCAIA